MKNKKYVLCMLGMVMTMLCMSGCGKTANDMQESYEESGSIQENEQEKTEESTQEHSQAADTAVNETANAVGGWIGEEYPYEQEIQADHGKETREHTQHQPEIHQCLTTFETKSG